MIYDLYLEIRRSSRLSWRPRRPASQRGKAAAPSARSFLVHTPPFVLNRPVSLHLSSPRPPGNGANKDGTRQGAGLHWALLPGAHIQDADGAGRDGEGSGAGGLRRRPRRRSRPSQAGREDGLRGARRHEGRRRGNPTYKEMRPLVAVGDELPTLYTPWCLLEK